MTEQQPQPNPQVEAEKIAASGDNIRERIRDTVTRAMQDRKLTLEQLTDLGGRMLDSAIAGVKDLPPKDKESTLRQVVDGLADAFERTANAARYALKESGEQTRTYTREEIDRTVNDLKTLQEEFVETLTGVTSRASKVIGDQTESLNRHIRRTAETIQPSIESALRAAAEHPLKLAGETASATLRAAPKAAGALLSTIGGLLQSAGDTLAGKREGGPATPAADKPKSP